MTTTVTKIRDQIEQQRKILTDLEQQLTMAEQEDPILSLARELHSLTCTWNHSDGCGWYYEIKDKQDDWTASAHGRYLLRAQGLQLGCNKLGVSIEQALAIYRLVDDRA